MPGPGERIKDFHCLRNGCGSDYIEVVKGSPHLPYIGPWGRTLYLFHRSACRPKILAENGNWPLPSPGRNCPGQWLVFYKGGLRNHSAKDRSVQRVSCSKFIYVLIKA